MLLAATLGCALAGYVDAARAVEWDDCATELLRLKAEADDANEKAERVYRAIRAVEGCTDRSDCRDAREQLEDAERRARISVRAALSRGESVKQRCVEQQVMTPHACQSLRDASKIAPGNDAALLQRCAMIGFPLEMCAACLR